MRRFCGWMLAGLTGFDGVLTRLNAVVTLDGFRALLEGTSMTWSGAATWSSIRSCCLR